MTEEQICQSLHVSTSAWAEYKKKFPELEEALKTGHSDLVIELKSSLIKKAKGYRYTETKVVEERAKLPEEMEKALLDAGFTRNQITDAKIIRKEIMEKEMSPDVAAINLALKNYDKENWANDPQMLDIRKQELEIMKQRAERENW